ncbi:MAG: sodium:solute symporter family protein [Lentisphaeria bacterium]|nr:sodium:solute symporter family protein [Lentisphaeria bacterium]
MSSFFCGGTMMASGAMLQLEGSVKYMLWGGIGFYVVLVLLIGYLSGRKVKNVQDFLVAGRRLPMWMATATLLATWFGAGSSMGVAATVYSGGIRDVLADPFGASVSLILAGIFLVGILRKMNHMTVTDVIQSRFGAGPAIYASFWMIPVYVGWLGSQVLGLGVILNLLTGVDLLTAQLIGAAVVLIYTATGGMWAVTLTDVVQVALIVAGLVLIVPGAISEAGGFSAVFQNPDVDYSLLPAAEQRSSFSGIVNYTGSWIIMGLGCIVGQDLMQRSLSSKDEKVAVSSSIMAGMFYLAIAIIPITIGLAAKILLPKWGITDAVMGGDLENQVMPRIAVGILGNIHPVILTLFLSALVSAIMSSADSSLLAASSLLTKNVIQPLCPKLTDEKLLKVTRIAAVLLLALATFLAMKVQSIYLLMTSAWASQLVVVFIPVFAAVYCKNISSKAIWCSMICATTVWLGFIFFEAAGRPEPLVEILADPDFNFAMTNGAVYGFAAGLAAFFSAWIGERIAAKVVPDELPLKKD